MAFWLACFALLAAVRLCHSGVLWADEAYGIAGARRILEGAALYRDVWFDKPPLYAWIYVLAGAQTGWVLRMVGASFAWLCCWLAARAARGWFGHAEGRLAGAAMAFFLSFDHPTAILSLAPDFLLIPFILLAVVVLSAGRAGLAGAVAAAGLLAHTKALLLLPVILVWRPEAWKRALAAFAATAAAVCLVAWGWQEPVWSWGISYARDTFVEHPLREGIRRTLNWAGFHAALVVGTALFFARPHVLRRRMAVWLAISLVAVSAGARFFPRYYLALLPVMAITTARGWLLLPRRWAVLVCAATLVVPTVRFGARHVAIWRGDPAALRDLALFEDCRQAAGRLREMAKPGDTLFVWGYRPELNVLAGLPGGTPFLDSQPLTGVMADRHLEVSLPTLPELARRNRMWLRQTSPTFIADGLGMLNPNLAINRYEDLRSWLSQYEVVAETRFTRIYRLRAPRAWRIGLRAPSGVARGCPSLSPAQAGRDGLRNLLAVKTTVLDEDLIGVHSGHDNPGQINALAFTLQRFRVGVRPFGFGIEADAQRGHEIHVGVVARHGENEIVLEPDLALGGSYTDGIRPDLQHARAEVSFDLASSDPVLQVGLDPVFDLVGDRLAPVDQGDAGAGPVQLQRGNGRGVLAADYRYIHVVIRVRLFVVVNHFG
jgi:hypothetical protein